MKRRIAVAVIVLIASTVEQERADRQASAIDVVFLDGARAELTCDGWCVFESNTTHHHPLEDAQQVAWRERWKVRAHLAN